MAENYQHEYRMQQRIKYKEKISSFLKELPDYCSGFDRSMNKTKQPRTRLAYLYDLDVFFCFLQQSIPSLKNVPVKDIGIDILSNLNKEDIRDYMDWLDVYSKENRHTGQVQEYHNENVGIKRKIATLRTFYNYLRDDAELLTNNPAVKVELPKLDEKDIRSVEEDELPQILDAIQEELDRVKANYERIKASGKACKRSFLEYAAVRRDLAIIYLFLGSGLRVSELVGINISDIKVDTGRINIVRKGGKEKHIYINGDVMEKIDDYCKNYRPLSCPENGPDKDALFLSYQKKRITVRQIEQRVERYIVNALGKNSGLSCHRLRATYGTNYYRSTGDIYATSAVMGHESVETTRKHYAKTSETALERMKDIDFLKIHK